METLVNQFKSFLLELPSSRQGGKKGLSKVSVKNYLSDIRRFLDWLSQYQPQISSAIPQRLSSDHFQAYLDFLTHQDLPHSTISRHFSSLRRFATFIEIVYHQPPLIIPTITSPDSTPKPEPTSIQTSSPNLLSSFSQYLKDQQKSASTVRNYLSDIRHFLAWVDQHPDLKTLPSAQQLDSSLESDVVDQYSHYLELTNTPSSTSSRRLSSLNIFTQFATNQGLVTPKVKPETSSPRLKPIPALSWLKPKTTSRQGFNLNLPSFIQKPITRLTSSPAYRSYHQLPFTPYLHLALLVLFTSAFALFGFRQIIIQSERIAAYPSTPNRPTRQLSFQGRLTDSSGTPIVTPINATFKLWDQETGGTEGTCSGGAGEDCLYSTTTCSVDPDQDGIFNVLLGDGACGSEIPADVFTENTAVWLEVEVATETLTPRQPIATVAYALNSETVSGIPVSASGSATVNTLFFMNSSGEIVLGEQNPSIVADSGNFTLQGEALTLSTTPFSEGDITIAPDGIGQVNFIGGTTTDDFIRVVNANLTTGSLISGYVGNNNNTGELLRLSSGSSETDRFVVTTGGQTTIDALAGGKSAFIVNQLNSGPIFTASASGTPKFTINNLGTITLANNTIITDDTNYTRFSRGIAVGSNETYYFNASGNINANNLTLSGTTTLNGLTYTWPSTQSSNYVLTTNGSGTLTWSDPTALAASTIYWNQANGSVYPKNATVDLLVGGNSTASAIFSVNSTLGSLTLKDSSLNTLFSVSPSGLVSNVPSSFTSSGNVSFAYDLLLTNQTSSSIKSNAPLTIEAGESFESNDLTLKTYNQGSVVIDSILAELAGGLSVTDYATISSSLALGNTNAAAGPGHLNMTGNLTMDGNLNLTSGALQTNSTTRITNTGNLTNIGTTQFNGLTYTWPTTHETSGYVLSNNGSGTLTWVDANSAASGSIYWTQTGAAVHPKNSTVDLLVGGSATSSAKFAVLNINSGTPTASISGTTANVATYLTGEGNLATTNMAPLTIGGSTTGSLTLDENTTITGNLALSGNEADLTFSGTGNHDITASAGTLRFGAATLTGAITGNSQNITGLNNLTGVTSTFSTSVTTPLLTNAGNLTLSATGANNILFSTNGTERWRVTSTGILQSNGAQTIQTSNANLTLATGGGNGHVLLMPNGTGNVGINNASPAYKLDVTGDINFTGALRANGTAGTTGQVLVSQGTSNPVWSDISGAIGGDAWLQGGNSFGATGVIGTNDNYDLQFETNNTTRMTIDTFGNIGINTTSPTARLDVAGTASLSGTLAFRGTTDPKIDILNGENLGIRTSSGGDTGLSERLTVLSNGNIGIGDTTPASLLTVGNGDLFQINSSGRIIRIEGVAHTIDDVSGNLTLTSNSTTISLNDNVTFAGTTTLNGLTYTWPSTHESSGYVLTNNGTGTLTWVDVNSAAAGNIYWAQTNGAVYPKNATVDLLVGGSSTSSAAFAFTGVSTSTRTATISGNLALSVPTGSAPTTSLDILNGGSLNLRTSVGGNTGLTSRLFVSNTGNVGVNTTSPGSKLQVQGSSDTSATSALNITDSSGNSNLHVRDDGKVSIGTTSPSSSLLTVDGGGEFSGAISLNDRIYLFPASWTGGYGSLYYDSNLLTLTSPDSFRVRTNGNDRIYINSSGSVGIGNSSPSSLFSVGSSSQFQVNTAGNIVAIGGASHMIYNSSGNLVINSAGTLNIADTNIQLSGGSTTLDVYNNAADTTFTINNSSATYRSHLSLEGQLKLGTYTATPSGIAAGAVYYDTTLDRPYYFNGLGNWVPFSAGEGGDGSKWTITDGSLHPNNSTLDLTIGGSSTSSAAFAFTGISSSTRTATISGNLALSVPTGTTPATTLNILNGGTFDIKTSVGGDAGLASRLHISNTGNIGIGTNSPSTKLHVYDNSGSDLFFKLENADTDYQSRLSLTSTRSWDLISQGSLSGSNGSFWIYDATASEARLAIDTSGNVGIGTTTPGAKLDIAGASSTITNTSGDITINSASGKISFAGDSLNNFLHATASGQIRPGSYGSDPYPIGDGAIIYRSDLGQLNYYNGSSWLNIGGGGSYWDLNAGLIHPTEYNTYDLAIGGDSTVSAKFFVDHSTGEIKIADTAGTNFHSIATDGNNLKITGSPNGSKLILQPDLQINGGDILGSSGATRISLVDTLSLTSVSGFLAVDRAATISAGLASDLTLHLKGAASQTANYMAITSNGGSTGNIFAIDSSGNVGIGTTSPSAKLDVAGIVTANDFLLTSDSDTAESSHGAPAQRRWKKTVTAGNIQELGSWQDTEGDVQLLVAVSSETGSNSGTNLYLIQGGYNQYNVAWSEVIPYSEGLGHGNSTTGFKLMVRRDTGYQYSLGVGIPSGLANKTLQVSVTELKGGMNFTDNSSVAAVAYSSAATFYSHNSLYVGGNVSISGTLAVGVMNQADAGTCNAAAEGRIFYDKGVRLYKACTYNSDNSSYAWRPLGGLSDQHRRNISTDSVVNNQVVRKGWTYAQGTGAVGVVASASYGITYDDVPIVLAVRAGTKTAAPAPTSLSQCTSSTYYIDKGQSMRNISTTGFQIEVASGTGTYPSTVYVCFSWIAIGTYSSGYGADLAEYYLTHDASLDAAEIVAIDPDNDIAVTKADPTTNPAVIGIVSTQAGAILGNKDGTTPGVETSITGQEVENGSKTVPVALAGRVPVKVSLENGPIYRGDALTLSPTLPGTAVKATTPGPIIGRALENFTGTATIVDSLDPDQIDNEQELEQEAFDDLNQGIGKIMVFIQNSYYSPVMTASSATSSATIAFDHQGNLINPNDDLTAQAQASTQTDSSFFDRFISLIVKNLTALNITSRSITTQELVSPLVEADQVTTNTLTTNLIKPQSDSDLILSLNNQSATTPAQLLITDSQDNTVTSIDSSGNATFSGELVANSAKFDSLEVGNLKANQIEGLTDTLSQIKSASEAAKLFLDRLTAKHSAQDESLSATAQQLVSTSSSQLLSTLEDNFTLDSDGTHLALTGLSSDYAYFSDYLAVEGTLMTNDLYVENNLITSSISSPLDASDQTLYLQPTGTGAINLLSGLLILDESGTVSLNGNLIVTGTLESGSATISGTLDLRATNLDNSGEATHSGFGRLLSIYNEQGEQVASVNASGSAQFNNLTTRQIIIAASQDSTPSASQLSTNSNTTIGTATIPAGELTTYIENNNITSSTLIYITPISDTKNQVLYVKNKYSCPVDAPLSCQPFFTVAINQPTTQDIQFNYWLIQVQ